MKVGDKVKPNLGPHKDHPHEVIHVFPDGKMNIKPIVPPYTTVDKFVKYKVGMVTVTPEQVEAI